MPTNYERAFEMRPDVYAAANTALPESLYRAHLVERSRKVLERLG